jgi:predicted transcriptional regulator
MDKELGRKLRVLREGKRFSQDALATMGRTFGEDWSRSTVAKWEAGQRDVTLDEFFTLALILQIPLGKSLRELVPDPVAPVDAKPSPGEVEQKAARALGITPVDVSRLAQRRWHTTLTAKRESLLSARLRGKGDITPRTLQAMRGRVTRTLLSELREELEKRGKRR